MKLTAQRLGTPCKLNRIVSAGLMLLVSAAPLFAQVYYGRVDENGGETLRQVNANGTGDAAFPLPFPKVLTPTWSRDGALLGLTAVDPARPSQITLNAWTYNPATGAKLNVTNFEDKSANTFSVTFALYKAFSPDRATMAVNSFIRSGGTDVNTTTTPILQLFPTNGDPGPTATLHVGGFRDEVHHDGEGVDWSPTQNLIAAPFKWDAPLQSGTTSIYGPGEDTAIFLINPVNSVAQQLTVPHADLIAGGGNVVSWAEEDYAPKFSPDGQSLAYVRSYQRTTGLGGPELDVQSLHIINLSTRQDSIVLQLQKGVYVTSLDWSPDGTQLVFDLGQQLTSNGFPVQAAEVSTDAINIVNINGTNPHSLVGPGAATPSWRPVAGPPSLSGLTNISTRLQVLHDPNELITGVIIHGTTPKQVLFRGLGPTLGGAPFNIAGALTDPVLELHSTDAQGHDHLVATNDDWKVSQQAAIAATGKAPPKDAEAAVLQTLAPGNYTLVMRGKNGGTGIGLVDAYDLTSSTTAQLYNISSRGFVGTGANAMIGGFIVGKSANFVVRSLGPTLSQFGVSGVLADPVLELRDANGTLLAGNDDWQLDANKSHLGNLAPPNAKECALYRTLNPGSYTALVRGKDNATGVALVEVYNLP